MVGKYLNGYGSTVPEPVPREVPPGWSEWYALTCGTEQKRYKYKLNENGKSTARTGRPRNYVTDVLARTRTTCVKR